MGSDSRRSVGQAAPFSLACGPAVIRLPIPNRKEKSSIGQVDLAGGDHAQNRPSWHNEKLGVTGKPLVIGG